MKAKSRALERVTPNGLRAVRVALGLTQREVAERAGVCPQDITYLERRYPATWRRLVRIADVLDASADEILGRVPGASVVPAPSLADRQLLEAMRQDAENTIGPDILARMGGWRRIARARWLGHLIGARDALLPRSGNDAPMIEAAHGTATQRRHFTPNAKGPLRLPAGKAPPKVEAPDRGEATEQAAFPKNWFKGWESPRQAAMRRNLPAPMSPRHLTARQAAARRRLTRGTA